MARRRCSTCQAAMPGTNPGNLCATCTTDRARGEDVDSITKQMKELVKMNMMIQSKLSTLETSLGEAQQRELEKEDAEVLADAQNEEDDDIVEVPNVDDEEQKMVAELVDLSDDEEEPEDITIEEKADVEELEETGLDQESRELLEMDSFNEMGDELDEEMEDDKVEIKEEVEEDEVYLGHQVEDADVEGLKDEVKEEEEEVKEEVVDVSDLQLPPGWKARRGKGRRAARFLLNSPDGRLFHTLLSAVLHMQQHNHAAADTEVMRSNLVHEGWRAAEHLPAGWLLTYYRPTNGFHYMNDQGKFFNSAKRAIAHLQQHNFDPKFAKDIKRNMVESKKFTGKLKFSWEAASDGSLPEGWKRRWAKGLGKSRAMVEFILTRDGVQFKSRLEALHYMLAKGYPGEQVEEARTALLASQEKWRAHELLPEGWIWKWKGEGRDREREARSTTITFLSREGKMLHSMKAAMEVMMEAEEYGEADLANAKEFLRSVARCGEKRHVWLEGGDTLPEGWKARQVVKEEGVEGESREYILSPEGISYRRGHSQEATEVMRAKMEEHEGWERSELLPVGWMYKKVCEGFTREKVWYCTLHYISADGLPFQSLKTAVAHMKDQEGWSMEQEEACKQFLHDMKSCEVKYEWGEGDETVPEGWRLRVSEGEASWQWMLSPCGRQYRSRYTALVDMLRRAAGPQEVAAMKELMVRHEGWQASPLLPAGWLFKVKSEGIGPNNKWYSTIHYLSMEGATYESMKAVVEFLEGSPTYTEQDIVQARRFLADQKAPEKKYEWRSGDESVPEGWRTRVSEGEAEMEWILSPEGRMYRSRVIALEDMVRRGCSRQEQQDMRAKMAFEGWMEDQAFPAGWLIKKWEGKTRSRGKLNQDLKFFTREGVRLDSFKTVLEAMGEPGYIEEDREKVRGFKESWSTSQRVGGFEWEECALTLPHGWKKRRGKGKLEVEMVLSPSGVQYRSRYAALLAMYKVGEVEEAEVMRGKLQFEGWEGDDLLPSGWLFKRIWEGVISNGTFSTNLHYLSREGRVFESCKAALEFLVTEGDYLEEDMENLRTFQGSQGRVSASRREDWEEAATVPQGWRVRGREGRQWVLRPDGQQFMTRCIAVQHLAREGYSQADIDSLRETMVHEGWGRSSLLPESWLFKVKEGRRGATNGYKFMCREGTVLDSAKVAMEHMHQRPGMFQEEAVEGVKQFVAEQTSRTAGDRFEWLPGGPALPAEWRSRVSQGESDKMWFLSPEGRSYRSRYSAVLDMVKKGETAEKVEEMKMSMEEHEGWERSELLPQGWMFKVIWEGFVKDKEWTQTVRYLSKEGGSFDSMKGVIDHLTSGESDHFESDVQRCKEFLAEQKAPEKKYSWSDGGDSLPAGWKSRVSEGEAKMEWILSPEGRMYRTRYVAVLDMVKKSYSEERVEEMKRSMEEHEGWERSELLPQGWMFKVIWEGFSKEKEWTQTIRYLSREGGSFDSMKGVIDHLSSGESDYSKSDVLRCKEFLAEQKAPEKKYSWSDGGAALPSGWKSRVSEGEAKMEWILSPEGRMYRSRYVAVLDMVKKGYSEERVEEMKRSMEEHEGWERSELLPKSWMFKVIWEGFTKEKEWTQTIRYLSREGGSFDSMKGVIDHLTSGESDYSEDDVQRCKEFLAEQKAPEKKYNWSDGGAALPAGWKSRVSEGEAKMEWILSPEGRMYRSRYVAVLDMVKKGYSEERVEEMKRSMEEHEGWERSELLPQGWMFKVVWEGFNEDGKWSQNLKFLTREGSSVESLKGALEAMEEAGGYTGEQVEAVREFGRSQKAPEKKYRWSSGGESLPAGWKSRVSAGEAKMEWVLSPEGRMYRSRFVAVQDMIKREYSEEDVEEMREVMVREEGWERDALLPPDWVYKVKWEGQAEAGRSGESLAFLSPDGQVFDSIKTMVEFVGRSGERSEVLVAGCAEFQRRRLEGRKRKLEEEQVKGEVEEETMKKPKLEKKTPEKLKRGRGEGGVRSGEKRRRKAS